MAGNQAASLLTYPFSRKLLPPARVREQRRMAGRRLLVGSTRHFFVRSHLSLLRSSVPVESGAPLSLSLSFSPPPAPKIGPGVRLRSKKKGESNDVGSGEAK